MDLIYTDVNHKDVGVLKDYAFDLAFGADENNFELKISTDNHCCTANCLIYIEGTEYGGIIDTINVTTEDETLTYKGRTWHGILGSKILQPKGNMQIISFRGEANTVIKGFLKDLGLLDLFDVPDVDSGLNLNGFMYAFVDAYSGIVEMLQAYKGKLKFEFVNGKVMLSAEPIVNYSKDEQFDSTQLEMDIEKSFNCVNHLICLGKGTSSVNRTILHLYRDANGEISENQTFFGLQEIVQVFDNPNSDTLKEDGIKKLQEDFVEQKVQMDFTSEDTIYDIGDIVGAKEVTTGLFVTEKITKKIVTIQGGLVNIQYKVGE